MAKNFDVLINTINGKYYKQFISKRDKVFSEEDLRVAFSSLVDSICEQNDISIPEERHEYSVYKGRIDSLYGEVILEYKAPNLLDSNNSSKKNQDRKSTRLNSSHVKTSYAVFC